MTLPVNIRWDQSTKITMVVRCAAITVLKSETKLERHFIPYEDVRYELDIPYPLARQVMEFAENLVRSNPVGVKLYDPIGVLLDCETGELYPRRMNRS